IFKKLEFKLETYKTFAAAIYGASDYRITVTNEEFSKSIINALNENSNLVCIAVVGNTHVPMAFKENNCLDLGLEERLKQACQRPISTSIVKADSTLLPPYHIGTNDALQYSPIPHISRAVFPLTLILKKIDNEIKRVKGFTFNWYKEDILMAL